MKYAKVSELALKIPYIGGKMGLCFPRSLLSIKAAVTIQKLFFESLHCGAFHLISSISTTCDKKKFSKQHQNKSILISAATIQERPLMARIRYPMQHTAL